MSAIDQILAAVKISDVYQMLTHVGPKLTGPSTWRAPAVWRGGDGLSVSGDDTLGVWHDFVEDAGGGVIDLVVRVRGGARHDALRWLAVFADVPLESREISPEERAQWAQERRNFARDLPPAQQWRRAAVDMAEEVLNELKAEFFDPTAEADTTVSSQDLQDVTRVLGRLQSAGEVSLVDEYRWWLTRYPCMTNAMVRVAKAREQAARRALLQYLRMTDAPRSAA